MEQASWLDSENFSRQPKQLLRLLLLPDITLDTPRTEPAYSGEGGGGGGGGEEEEEEGDECFAEEEQGEGGGTTDEGASCVVVDAEVGGVVRTGW